MNWDLTQRSRTAIGSVPSAPRERTQSKMAGAVYERQLSPALPPSSRLYTAAGREVV
ncbi:unnamed protein product, partial [Staurois parvus]